MQYCIQVEAVFSSEIIWTDVLNARRWNNEAKMTKMRAIIEAKIAAKSRRAVSVENIQQVLKM